MTRQFGIINWFDNVNWPSLVVSKLTFKALALRQSKRVVKFFFLSIPFLVFHGRKIPHWSDRLDSRGCISLERDQR